MGWRLVPSMFVDFMFLWCCCDGLKHERVSLMFSSTRTVSFGWQHAATDGFVQLGLAEHQGRGARRPNLRHPRIVAGHKCFIAVLFPSCTL